MADLLFRISWAAQNHFMPRFAFFYTQGACQKRQAGQEQENLFAVFSHKNSHLKAMKKIIYMASWNRAAEFIARKRANNAPKLDLIGITLRPKYPVALCA